MGRLAYETARGFCSAVFFCTIDRQRYIARAMPLAKDDFHRSLVSFPVLENAGKSHLVRTIGNSLVFTLTVTWCFDLERGMTLEKGLARIYGSYLFKRNPHKIKSKR